MKSKLEDIYTNGLFRVLLAILATFLWGSAFPAVKIGYDLFNIGSDATYGKILFAGYRFFLAGVLIFLVFAVKKRSIKSMKVPLRDVVILGFLMTTFQYAFFYIGLSNTTGVKGAVLNSTTVFFTIVLAHFLLKNDNITKGKILGLVFGFTGVVLINYSPELLQFQFSLEGEGLLLLAQLSGALGAIYLKKNNGETSIVLLTAYQMMLGSLLLIIPGILMVGPWPFITNTKGIFLLIYLALLSATAFSVWNLLIKYNAVGKIAMFKFLIPIFGVLLSGVLLAEERITSSTIIALIIVSLGIISVNKTRFSLFNKAQKE